ncbi:heme-dependent oxidative N-demethylase family protein [Neobacillus sp. LXY-4]|uniref:heme-dependent oxidative N-demethylase family protein n=1 Tax=Neobacillus sp. LXY-4 TaxID=3379826 RepID=UPI003EDF8921
MIESSITPDNRLIDDVPLISRYPFPFKGDSYRYSNNSAALESGKILEITSEYFAEIGKKRQLLTADHNRSYQSFPHSLEAQWEAMEMIMNELCTSYPQFFSLEKKGDRWVFENHLLNEKTAFILGDAATLPYEPLDFIGRHVQEDLVYVAQRDGDLYMDAGQLCFPANWSIVFDAGMTFTEWHSPVPVFSDSGLAEKVKGFLMRMEAGKPWTRLNWTLTVDTILDTFPENYQDWGVKKENITIENAGQLIHLRTEDQRLFRMPRSNGILFSIHTHLIPLDELRKNKQWLQRFYHVMLDLPDYMAEYKGFLSYKEKMLAYLENEITSLEERG